MTEPSMFLTPDQVAELTGIKAARDGMPKSRRQSLALSRMGIPHYVNAVDRVQSILDTEVAVDVLVTQAMQRLRSME